MGTIYDNDMIKMSLFDKTQNHGHCISHIHVNDHGDKLWIDAEGNIVKGKSNNSKAIVEWVRRNQPEIKERLRLLAEGKEISKIEGDYIK